MVSVLTRILTAGISTAAHMSRGQSGLTVAVLCLMGAAVAVWVWGRIRGCGCAPRESRVLLVQVLESLYTLPDKCGT